MKTWKGWGTKELERLADMRRDGMTIAEIAAALGRTYPSVKCAIQKSRVRWGRNMLLNRWLPAFRRPHTIAGLAEEFGVTKWAVKNAKRRLRRMGYDVPDSQRKDRKDVA